MTVTLTLSCKQPDAASWQSAARQNGSETTTRGSCRSRALRRLERVASQQKWQRSAHRRSRRVRSRGLRGIFHLEPLEQCCVELLPLLNLQGAQRAQQGARATVSCQLKRRTCFRSRRCISPRSAWSSVCCESLMAFTLTTRGSGWPDVAAIPARRGHVAGGCLQKTHQRDAPRAEIGPQGRPEHHLDESQRRRHGAPLDRRRGAARWRVPVVLSPLLPSLVTGAERPTRGRSMVAPR